MLSADTIFYQVPEVVDLRSLNGAPPTNQSTLHFEAFGRTAQAMADGVKFAQPWIGADARDIELFITVPEIKA